ncbi:MAG: hypothetical protein Q7Q71_02015 [Verrucomicrobiota bacterium JB023]|nr:hypothetical protein [Verrucomicrobiota bacterium JB023]
MSDENGEHENAPGERRVKKRRQKRVSRDSLYLKRKQLLQEMQESEDSPITVRDQVEALKKGERVTDDEERWGDRSKRKRGSQWMLWAVIGLAVPVLVVGLIAIIQATAPNATNEGVSDLNIDFDAVSAGREELTEQWFYDNAGDALSKAVDVLEVVNDPDVTAEELGSVLRNEEQVERILASKEAGEFATFDLRNPTQLNFEFGSSADTGFMTVIGNRSDFRSFRAYFVTTADGLRLDADATECWSEVAISRLPEQEIGEGILVRAFLRKEPHFDNLGDQDTFSWYQLLDQYQENFVWAYATTSGPVDEKLKELLNYGRFLEGRDLDGERVTLRISKPQGVNEDEFTIDEVLAEEWVVPADRS